MTGASGVGCDGIERGWCYYRNLVHTCYREARHLGKPGDKDAKLSVDDPDLQQAMARIAKWRVALGAASIFDKVAASRSTPAIRKPWEDITSLDLAQLKELFARSGWTRSYGGEKWAAIVALTIRLGNVLDAGDDPAVEGLCDEIAGAEHNSGRLVPRNAAEQRTRPTKWPQLCD